jgi:acetyl-CoA acyltransferase
MREVVIVSAVRSAVAKGKQGGALANVHAVDLSAHLM